MKASSYLPCRASASPRPRRTVTDGARIAGVHDTKKLNADPAFALGNLFGKLPLSRTPLLKALASETKDKTKEVA